MHLVIQGSGDGVVPRQLLGQISQLLGAASPEQGADTGFPQGKVPQSFEQVKHNREGHGVEHERFKRAYHLHLEQVDWTERNEPQLGVTRVLQSQLRKLIGGEASRGDDVTERTL